MRTSPRVGVWAGISKRTRVDLVALAVLFCAAPWLRAGASETITATAHLKSAGGVEASAPVSIVVDRFSTDRERDELLAALKDGGTTAAKNLLLTRTPLGSVQVGSTSTAIKFAYARTTGDGRLITAVTGSPIAFVGAGLPGAKSKSGFDLGLVLLEISAAGPGRGELAPATNVRVNDQGAIVTEDYSAELVRLSHVVSK